MKFTLLALPLLLIGTFALASGGHAPKSQPQKLGPSQRYSGSAPIDMSNGLSFNNGTFGERNAEYEAWGNAPTIVPGLSEKIYPYNMKANFVGGLQDRVQFFEHALFNWEQTSPETKPEVVEYSKNAVTQLRPFIDKLRDATKKAGAAGQNDWDGAQAEARKALVDVYGLYKRLHHNVVL